MWVRSLGQEDLLEEGMTTHSGILAWKIPWTEEPGRLQSSELQRVRHNRGEIYTHSNIAFLIKNMSYLHDIKVVNTGCYW